MKSLKAKIIKNEQAAPHVYKMTLAAPAIAKAAKPGQFVMVRTIDSYQPLLRRPFGAHKAAGSNIEILYEVVGEGTRLLSQKKSGEFLGLIGPLGNGFDYPLSLPRRQADAKRYPPPILIAGGIGVAPLFFLAEKLRKQKPIVLLGAKAKSEILCEKEFKELGCEVKVATDDGSKGYKGFVTDLLMSVVARSDERKRGVTKQSPSEEIASGRNFGPRKDELIVYACGPKPMLKTIAEFSKKYRIPAQVSLEEYMACGIGACLGCVVNTKTGQKRVCKEGPVFSADEIIWE